jgi:hypothetical protein
MKVTGLYPDVICLRSGYVYSYGYFFEFAPFFRFNVQSAVRTSIHIEIVDITLDFSPVFDIQIPLIINLLS